MSKLSEADQGLKIAITGSMGSGKSAVCEIIKKAGWPLISADEIVADLYDFDTFVKIRLKDMMGEEIIEDQRVSRKVLFAKMMESEVEKKRVEALIHPLVEKKMWEYFDSHQAKMMFAEVPLLYESGWENKFDQVWVVAAQDEIRIDRLINKRKVSKSQALALMSYQMDQRRKMELADVVIDNNGNLDDLHVIVTGLLQNFGGDVHVKSQ